jgi:nicotinamide mononucleotide (NMN) deamidase PncC
MQTGGCTEGQSASQLDAIQSASAVQPEGALSADNDAKTNLCVGQKPTARLVVQQTEFEND